MKKGKFTEAQIVGIVRESVAGGVPDTARKHKISDQTIYNWRKKYGNMEVSQVAELKRLTKENSRLKKILAERVLEIEVMQEINAKKW